MTSSAKPLLSNTYDIKTYLNTEIRSPELSDNLASNYKLETKTEHETVNISSVLNLSLDDTRKLFNPESQLRKVYIMLDRRFRSSESIDRTLTTWNFQTDNNTEFGSVNVLGSIRDITSMKIFDYYMNVLDSTYQCDQMIQTVFIPEFQAQSFIAPEKRRFHFWGKMWTDTGVVSPPTYMVNFSKGADVIGTSEYLYRLQDGNDGVFEFRVPVTTINTLSLTFGSPYQLMPLVQDIYNFVYVSGGVGSCVITTTVPHNIPVGKVDRVYITGFTTTNPVADATLISLLNDPPNGIVWVGQSLDSTTITITPPENVVLNVVFPALVGTQTTNTTIYFDYYRFYVGLELTYKTDLNDL